MQHGSSLLVVEDDWSIRESIQAILTDEGYAVSSAENGKEAFELLKTSLNQKAQLPCLILLDLNMPVMTGEAFLVLQKEHVDLKHIPVAVFTAAGGKQKPELAEDFVRKPIDLEDLLNLVEKYCKKAV
jgi:CheY-like chemotaxis protein